MAENNDTETDVDIFQTLKKTNESLVEVLATMSQQEQPVYVPPSQPAPKSPNYLLYAGIGLLALILFRKVKL